MSILKNSEMLNAVSETGPVYFTGGDVFVSIDAVFNGQIVHRSHDGRLFVIPSNALFLGGLVQDDYRRVKLDDDALNGVLASFEV